MAFPYTSYQGGMYQNQNGYYQQPVQPIQPVPNQISQIQPMQYYAQAQNAAQQIQSGNIWVNGFEEVNAFPVAPNTSVRLWHKNKPILYIKTADASGRPTIEAYDLHRQTELDDSESEKQTEYALKSDLASFASAVSGINQMVTALKTDVDAIKGDMYGVVGKKKTTKKSSEAVDNDAE